MKRSNAPLSVHSCSGFFGLLGVFFRSFFRSFFCCFLCSFWGGFGVPFWEVFGAKKVSKFELVIFGFSLFFIRFFYDFCDLEGLKFVLFSFFFRIVFLIDFWSLLVSILAPFWHPFGTQNLSFLASIFW